MTDFKTYKKLLEKANTEYETWQDGTMISIFVQDENSAFSLVFDVLTGDILSSELYCFVYSD